MQVLRAVLSMRSYMNRNCACGRLTSTSRPGQDHGVEEYKSTKSPREAVCRAGMIECHPTAEPIESVQLRMGMNSHMIDKSMSVRIEGKTAIGAIAVITVNTIPLSDLRATQTQMR